MGKDQELLEAARTGNVALVEKLLSGRKGGILGGGSGPLPLSNLLSIWRGPNVNCTDSSGYTALHHAALNGHKDIVLKLLQYEASTNVADNKGYFPIHLAAWKGDVEIVKILIHHGPSHSRVNEQNNENETALHCAAQYGHSEVVAVLLEELTDPTIRNSKLETPLDLAALYGRLRVVKMIISAHPNLMSCNTRKHTPLHLAARNGHKAVVQVLLEAGMDVSCQTEKGSALHEAALFGKVDVVRVLLETGIDANIKDSLGRTVLDILKEHPSQKSLQIATLLQEYLEGVGRSAALEEHVQEDTTQEIHISSPVESPSQKTKSETVTGELSKLLDEIKLCQEKDYSFEDLCHTISDHYLDNLSKISEEELGKNGSQSVRTSSTINLSPGEVEEEDDDENTCGPSGLWEALTPCNGCRNLGFPILAQESYPKKRNYTMEIVPSASLDTFPSENENFLCDLTDIAVTKKPCSLEIARAPSPRTDNASEVAITAPGNSNHRNSSTGPTPDCSPPSPDTALKNIVKVIRPQPKQRTSIVSSLDFHRMNHNQEYFEINTSAGCASFTSSPPISPPTSSVGTTEVKNEGTGHTDDPSQQEESDPPKEYDPGQFAGLLHGSSPACESPENPFHLYGKRDEHEVGQDEVSLANSPLPFKKSPIANNSETVVKKIKPKVVSRTIFHKKSNQLENHTIVGTRTTRSGSRNGDQWIVNTGGFVERACTLGRIRSLPKALIDMHLSKNVSKSDSDLIAYPSTEKTSRVNWSESSTAEHSSKGNSERTPSFTSEWEEIDKIMNSIDVGINSELEEMNSETTRPRCPVQTVGQWLESIGLPQYENHLMANGFDNVQFMGSNVMEDQDLLEIGILNSGHRQRILQAIQLLPKMRPIGHDGYHPTSVAEWLDSIELGDYTKAFLINGYTSMDLLKKIWEVELINVLKINLIGHRKRILASLGDRLHDDPPQKPPRSITLRGDARRRRNENYFDDIPRSKLERQMAQQSSVCEIWTNQNAGFPFSAIHQVHNTGDWGEPSITLRPPNEATASTPVQYWQHHPEKLIFQSCDYKAFYLGSMLIKELRGTESTQDACAKMRANCQKSTEQMKKVPTIILSVSYKGVKFIDATNKNIIAEHEIRNISCAAQDPEDLSTFAYITKDLKSNHHYCHVFTAFDVNLAYEIILTLGQAFEVAYQLALQARKGGHSSTLPESFENKPSKPIPKPRVSIRKSVQIDPSEQKTLANLPWIVEPGQEAKRGINTKYETTIF
ncbi:ankyrin repeat and sterile alpha motif domain-containing protein 1B isoform X10 [Canis lupus baileyi]|uniref:ankyrin repeat and sterile alpha motif domain-containing protein 1B isoform X10 n=1 Tax=Canis lupus familiaris TaxID=9615 RepID=UPI000BAA2946|nr:ankyrin repeat and sterile alpha motif domain-containing protein 1B isoform X10 [Canis lupus familiaris]XP_025295068.1 ankyrin repeat and sterile alpha motif domain-containing protein 1B isoform X9 [Canis lupus dingo]XP_038414673.1 ankyrin repeat and sterile alpha motif domain-containing protein 1B isoform X10 [Canis lupus familiaris]XP_038544260.1 ankyrin repeat and sterile alpha motif domain-containing protein 1B isoform X10 [Canis lupus familiaris]|eukprot:XP_022259079.1 ankyrin repeat and sterile alpha motif domain-containing protein 1B isoform X10 [Canis lupus familiaris]